MASSYGTDDAGGSSGSGERGAGGLFGGGETAAGVRIGLGALLIATLRGGVSTGAGGGCWGGSSKFSVGGSGGLDFASYALASPFSFLLFYSTLFLASCRISSIVRNLLV